MCGIDGADLLKWWTWAKDSF